MLSLLQVVNEVKDSSDARELLLASITQADTLTHVVNKRITAEHVQQQPSEDSAPGKCRVKPCIFNTVSATIRSQENY